MKSIGEILRSNKRFAILGGRTPKENAEYWQTRWAAGTGIVWPNGPKGDRAHETLPEAYDFREHLGRCAVPNRIVDVLAGTPTETEAIRSVRAWIEGDNSLLLLHGESGVGKSVAGASVFKAARATVRFHGGDTTQWDSHNCWFLGAAEMARESYFSDDGKALVQHVKRVQLLVLDDLGAELISSPYLATLDEVITARFEDRTKRTVLTTNVSASRPTKDKVSDFEARYGARVARRIRDGGSVVHVKTRGTA